MTIDRMTAGLRGYVQFKKLNTDKHTRRLVVCDDDTHHNYSSSSKNSSSIISTVLINRWNVCFFLDLTTHSE